MQLKVKKLSNAATIPTYATDGSGGFDLYAATVNGYTTQGEHVDYGYPVVASTEMAFEIPPGYVMLVFSRSGHGFKHDTRLANCVGVIDSDYRGAVAVKLTSDKDQDMPLYVKPGDRVAQAMLVEIPRCEFIVVDELSTTDRGSGGFGSTGE